MFGPQDILRPPHARSRPFCYRSIPAHAQTTRNYLVYILSSLELGCAGVRQGVRAIHPSIWGPKRHLQTRRTQEVGSRWICILAPARLATFFGMATAEPHSLVFATFPLPFARAPATSEAASLFDVSRSGHARLAPDGCEARKCSFIVEIARPNALPFSFAPAAVFGPTEFTDGAAAAPTDLLPAGCSATRSVI